MAALQAWLEARGLQLPTPAAAELRGLVATAADSRRLREQLNALRDSELDLAAREAEDNAATYALLEEENLGLAADNARLAAQLDELRCAREAEEADLAAKADEASSDDVDVAQRAEAALQRAAETRRLSGAFEVCCVCSSGMHQHAAQRRTVIPQGGSTDA